MHIIWDWNGTLFDDIHIVLDAANEVLRRLGAAPISGDDYRSHFTRPVHRFYERILGRALHGDEFALLDEAFHDSYRARTAAARLAEGAEQALATAAAHGIGQSLLSMWRHEELLPFAARHGIAGHMRRIDGLRDGRGEAKAPHMARHAEALGLRPGGAVVIGDSVDDAEAAATLGFHCVLFDGGTHHLDTLRAHGPPVAHTLAEAVSIARGLLGS